MLRSSTCPAGRSVMEGAQKLTGGREGPPDRLHGQYEERKKQDERPRPILERLRCGIC